MFLILDGSDKLYNQLEMVDILSPDVQHCQSLNAASTKHYIL